MGIQGCVDISTLMAAILHCLLIQYYIVKDCSSSSFALVIWVLGLNHYIPGKLCELYSWKAMRCSRFQQTAPLQDVLLSDSDMGPVKQPVFFKVTHSINVFFHLIKVAGVFPIKSIGIFT